MFPTPVLGFQRQFDVFSAGFVFPTPISCFQHWFLGSGFQQQFCVSSTGFVFPFLVSGFQHCFHVFSLGFHVSSASFMF